MMGNVTGGRMPAVAPAIENLTLSVTQEIHVRASVTATFAALLEQMGPANEGHSGSPLPMTIEPWPGGRWFRAFWTHPCQGTRDPR
jgi:hypothetical protein